MVIRYANIATGLFVFLTAVVFNAQAALVERLSGAAYFDKDTGLTWLADASASGMLDWHSALDWADGLDIDGITGWRLPTADTSCATTGVACPNSEMGNLHDILGVTATSPDPFMNIRFENYWTSTMASGSTAYQYNFLSGLQLDNPVTSGGFYAWAVLDGDPAVVPVPPAVWLFASGLLGLIGIARRHS